MKNKESKSVKNNLLKKPEDSENNLKSKNLTSLDLLIDVAIDVGGKNASFLVELLKGNKHVNEFIVAKKLELTINQTRNILYKLADEGLVSSIRKKDKKKGWYTYFWIFNSDKAFLLLQKKIIKDLEQLEHQLKSREMKQFYICKTCNSEVTEETALLHDFTCPECGEIYQISHSNQIVSEIKQAINKLNKKMEQVNLELVFIEEKRVKKLERDKRKLEKEKIAKRKKAAEERKKARKKLEKATGKNKPLKKVSKKSNKKKKKVVKKVKKKKPSENKPLKKVSKKNKDKPLKKVFKKSNKKKR